MTNSFIRAVTVVVATFGLSGCGHTYKRWFPHDASASDVAATTSQPFQFYRRRTIQTGVAEVVGANNARALDAMYGAERQAIAAAKGSGKGTRSSWHSGVGLALSGGGVRSGSFAVGVMHGLYDSKLLDRFGYLSSVSGGGYAASWFEMHRDPLKGCSNQDLFRDGGDHLYHLAQFGHYLGNGNGLKSKSAAALQVAGNLFWIPVNIFANFVINTHQNLGSYRRFYRNGLRFAYQYKCGTEVTETPHFMEEETMAAFGPTSEKPFWIINMNLSLVDDDNHHKGRASDGFELTPQRAGASAVGYVLVPPRTLSDKQRIVDIESDGARDRFSLVWSPTLPKPVSKDSTAGHDYSPYFENYWMSPSYATAISGAAIEGRSAFHGAAAGFALNLLNLNLGYYVPGWSQGWLRDDSFGKNLLAFGSFYVPMVWPLYGFFSSHSNSAQGGQYLLSDGGHFEDLGVYALIRRGVRLIVISDGDAEPDANGLCVRGYDNKWRLDPKAFANGLGDLHKLEVMIANDFGSTVEWNLGEVCSTHSAKPLVDRPHSYVWSGVIRNLPLNENDAYGEVHIVYIRSAFPNDDQLLTANGFLERHKENNPKFSNESTANQFFGEDHVLSYMVLGRSQIGPGSPGGEILKREWETYCGHYAGDDGTCLQAVAGSAVGR